MVMCTVILFIVLAIVFLTTGTILLAALAKHFPSFYYSFRGTLITVIILMTVPLVFRAILDGLKAILPNFLEWIDGSTKNNSIYNFIFFILTTYIPIVS